jgi:RNA recognition motif-containing protein
MEIFITNLDPGIEENLLTTLFEAFGSVTSSVLIRDKETRVSKGYGFIIMENVIDAKRAIDDLNGRKLAGKILGVKPSVPKGERASQKVKKYPTNPTIRDKDESNFSSEAYEEADAGEKEEITVEVINGTAYKKSVTDDGLIKISFCN